MAGQKSLKNIEFRYERSYVAKPAAGIIVAHV